MDQLQQKLIYKSETLQCAHVCGGITGYHIDSLCPDDTVLRGLLESGRIHKIPVQIGSGENIRKIMVFEDAHHARNRRSNALSFFIAKDMCYMNDCYLRFRERATKWLDADDIAALSIASGLEEKWKRPCMMFYDKNTLCGIVLSRKIKPLEEEVKKEIAEKLKLDECIEIVVE